MPTSVLDANPRADGVPVRFGSDQAKANAPVSGALIVSVQIRRPVVGGDQKVKVTIAIEISVGESPSHLRLAELCSGFARHVTECSLPVVQKQLRRLCVTDVSPDVPNGIVDMSVGDGQIKIAVQVHVEESAAKAQAVLGRKADARRGGYILIRAVPLGSVKPDHFIVEVGDGDSGCSRVGEISRVHTHAGPGLAFDAQARPASMPTSL